MKQRRYRGRYTIRKKHLPLWLWMLPASLLAISLVAVGMILLNRHSARVEYQQLAKNVHQSQTTAGETAAPADGAADTQGSMEDLFNTPVGSLTDDS